jgi:hypothetical protein
MLHYWSSFVSNKGCQLQIIIFHPLGGISFFGRKIDCRSFVPSTPLRYESGAVVSDGKDRHPPKVVNRRTADHSQFSPNFPEQLVYCFYTIHSSEGHLRNDCHPRQNHFFNVRKVLWTCEEAGLEYLQEDYGSGLPQRKRILPRAESPTHYGAGANDDDFVLWESNAICRYLARKADA